MKTLITIIIILLSSLELFSQEYPSKPDSIKPINDYINAFTQRNTSKILDEIRKTKNEDHTSIIIVTVKTIGNANIEEYTFNLAKKWDLVNNDRQIFIVYKPKYYNEKGEIYISTWFRSNPDIITDYDVFRIVQNNFVKYFKRKQISKGFIKGIKSLRKAIRE